MVPSDDIRTRFFFHFQICKTKLLMLSLGLDFLQIDLIICVRARVKHFDLASGVKLFEESISFVNFWFAVKIMISDWSVDRVF